MFGLLGVVSVLCIDFPVNFETLELKFLALLQGRRQVCMIGRACGALCAPRFFFPPLINIHNGRGLTLISIE